jgi:hypothetical protein
LLEEVVEHLKLLIVAAVAAALEVLEQDLLVSPLGYLIQLLLVVEGAHLVKAEPQSFPVLHQLVAVMVQTKTKALVLVVLAGVGV